MGVDKRRKRKSYCRTRDSLCRCNLSASSATVHFFSRVLLCVVHIKNKSLSKFSFKKDGGGDKHPAPKKKEAEAQNGNETKILSHQQERKFFREIYKKEIRLRRF